MTPRSIQVGHPPSNRRNEQRQAPALALLTLIVAGGALRHRRHRRHRRGPQSP
jgi:hypothetical protein